MAFWFALLVACIGIGYGHHLARKREIERMEKEHAKRRSRVEKVSDLIAERFDKPPRPLKTEQPPTRNPRQ